MSTQTVRDASAHPHQGFLMWAQCIDEPLALIDEDGVLVASNASMRDLFSLGDEEDDEMEIFDLILTEDGQKILAHWDGSILERQEPIKFIARHMPSPHDNVSPRTMLWSLKPAPLAGFWLLAVRDVELEKSGLVMPRLSPEPDLSAPPSRASLANLLQAREFLTTLPRIIHDLKAPNRRVRMFAQLLRRQLADVENEEVLNYINSIVENASRNESLVEEIKSYFSLHKLTQKPATISIQGLLERASQQAAVPLERITVEGPVHLEVKLPLKLAVQVIAELIENAATHGKPSPDQDATISVVIARTEPELGASSPWTLRISDQGRGFREGIEELLFEPLRTGLSQASAERSSISPRFGMGLATAQRCMLFLGGEIELTSETPGATFLLTFPPLS